MSSPVLISNRDFSYREVPIYIDEFIPNRGSAELFLENLYEI